MRANISLIRRDDQRLVGDYTRVLGDYFQQLSSDERKSVLDVKGGEVDAEILLETLKNEPSPYKEQLFIQYALSGCFK